jgi:hypothetical protein
VSRDKGDTGGRKDHQKGKEQGDSERSLPERSLVEARFEGTHGQPIMKVAPLVQNRNGAPASVETAKMKVAKPGGDRIAVSGIKKSTKGKANKEDSPPTPRGCQWLKADNGWNLWRYWTEKDPLSGERIRKTRYAGFLSQEAWQIMKDYDYETFISIIGQRLRRYGQR